MINLLPPSAKQDVIYGRRNSKLIIAIMSLGIVIAIIGAITVFGQLFISKNEQSYISSVETTKQRIRDQKLEESQKQLGVLSDNFKTVVQILNKQVLFSKLFEKIGSTVPDNAVLTELTLTNEDTALNLTFAAKDRETANQAFVNASDPQNGLFEKADLVKVSCVKIDDIPVSQRPKFACSTDVRVLLKPNSPFLFLNALKEEAKQ